MTKAQLRTKYKTLRKDIGPLQKDKLEDLILIQFQKLALEIPSVILSYAESSDLWEYDPVLVERFCSFRNPGLIRAYPKITEDGDLNAMAVNEATEFSLNVFRIDEPVNGVLLDPKVIDMVIVPLLAYDENGFRVGYGKGYYDRFLKKCRDDVWKVGFSFFGPDNIDDIHVNDIPLDICITPERHYTFIK